MTDPIADMVVRIKNASAARKHSVSFPYSKLKMSICALLEKEGFIGSVARKGKKSKMIEANLLYDDKSPKVRGVKRISKPSRRVYVKVTQLKPVKNGYGVLLLSSPKGIVTDRAARKDRVGGEALFEIW